MEEEKKGCDDLMIHSPLLLASACLLIASAATSTTANSFPVPADIIQGSAILSLTCTIWYLLAKTFPAHLKAMKDQRDAFLKHLKERE